MSDIKTMHLVISRVDEPIFEGQVRAVSVPGVAGDMQILPHHEPLISPLKKGVVTIYKNNDKKESHIIDAGTLEVSNNQVTILI